MTPMALDIAIGTPTNVGEYYNGTKYVNFMDYDIFVPIGYGPLTALKRIPIRFICDFNKLSNFGQELFSCNRNILV